VTLRDVIEDLIDEAYEQRARDDHPRPRQLPSTLAPRAKKTPAASWLKAREAVPGDF
jgi:hypothetical protein